MIAGLDGIRAIAFLLVFFVHTNYLQIGWIGVQLFFVLSGFLITGILVDMKANLPAAGYFLKFYGRRFLRIFPLYYFYLVLMALLAWVLISIPFRKNFMDLFFQQLPYALTYIYNFFYASFAERSPLLDHFWSLAVEEQFYIVWPLLIFLTPDKWQKKLFIGAIAAGFLFRLGVTVAYRLGAPVFAQSSLPLGLYPLPLTHLDAFAFGAFISRNKIPKARLQFVILTLAVPFLGFLSQYLATGSIGAIWAFGYPFGMPKAYEFVWGYTLLNYWFAVTIYAVARDGLFVRFLEWAPLRYLGKISYGLYVYHMVIIWFLTRLRDVVPISWPILKALVAASALVLTILVASVSYSLIEKPVLNLKEKFFVVRSHPPV